MKKIRNYVVFVISAAAILAPVAAQIVEKPVPGDPIAIFQTR
jgi:hypothetical protein